MKNSISLFNNTHFSKNSILYNNTIINYALNNCQKYIGSCEEMNFFGAMDFSLEAIKNKIKPIIGNKLLVTLNGEEFGYVCVFLKNQEGFQIVSKLISDFYVNHQQAIALEDLFNCDNIIIVIGAYSKLYEYINNNNFNVIENIIILLKKNFINNMYFGYDNTNYIHKKIIYLSNKYLIPLIYEKWSYFYLQEDFESYCIYKCIINKQKYNDVKYDQYKNNYLLNNQQINESNINIYKSRALEEAIENTHILSKRCNFFFKEQKPKIPTIILPKPLNEEFKEKTMIGLEKRLIGHNIPNSKRKKYYDQLKKEWIVICNKNFCSYFLIVNDFIMWAKTQSISVGPGRGSGAGSICAWALGITEVDPIKFNLIFERFLNPERKTIPDFDIDFCQVQREKVLEYCKNKYGKDHFAHIITFGYIKAKMAIKDSGRTLGMFFYEVEQIAQLIPNDIINPVTLSKTLENDEKLKDLYNSKESVKRLIDVALKIEGLSRHTSTHAAGVVISDKALYCNVPLYKEKDGETSTQFNMGDLEKAGLIKFDFLGLKTLTIIDLALKYIKKNHGKTINIWSIDLNNKKVLDYLSTGKCEGIFQMESIGVQNFIRHLKPDSFNEIIALISLNRPGPIDEISKYIKRKHGKEPVQYLHKSLESILDQTYGIIIYQEQVMEIARKLSGYSYGEADILLRAMSKKKFDQVQKQRIRFLDGIKKHNVSQEIGDKLFDLMEKFAGYAFNKAHATSYAFITMATAYLKSYYIHEFFLAYFNLEFSKHDKIQKLINDYRNHGGIVESPNINQSNNLFTLVNKKILYGLEPIKGIGKYGIVIEEERAKNGLYLSVNNFLQRHPTINRKIFKALLYSGAFNCLNSNLCAVNYMGEMFFNTRSTTTFIEETKHWSKIEELYYGREALGFFLNEHPVNYYNKFLGNIYPKSLKYFAEEMGSDSVIVLIEQILKKKNRNGNSYAFITLSGINFLLEAVVFSKVLQIKHDFLKKNTIVVCKLKKNNDKVIIDDIIPINQIIEETKYNIIIYIDNFKNNNNITNFILKYVNGNCNIQLSIKTKFNTYKLTKSFNGTHSFFDDLEILNIKYAINC